MLFHPALNCKSREQQEHKVYWQLLDMIPCLEEHLMSEERSDKDLVYIAKLVSTLCTFELQHLTCFVAPESGFQCQSWQHKGLERSNSELDNSAGRCLETSSDAKQQIWVRIQSQANWTSTVPYRVWLEESPVSSSDPRSCSTTMTHLYRTKQKLKFSELPISGKQWPIFIYEGNNFDPEDPWKGLLRSNLMVMVWLFLIWSPYLLFISHC